MPNVLEPVVFPSGVMRRSTRLLAEGYWFDMDKMRSVGGVLETLGGWDEFNSELAAMTGVARGIKTWTANDGRRLAAFGTHKKLYIWNRANDGALENVTPIRDSGSLGTDPFDMTDGSAVVVVNDTSHGVIEGDTVSFSGATAAHGITIDGEYIAGQVIDANSFNITHSAAATSTGSGGGASVNYEYELNIGKADAAFSFGFGTGAYGAETFGTPRSTSNILLQARAWHLDTRGEDLIAQFNGGSMYQCDVSGSSRATVITNAPTPNNGMFVAPEGHLVALGAGGDPKRVENSDLVDITIWSAAAANQASGLTVHRGNSVLAGAPLRAGLSIILTDTQAYRLTYLRQTPWYSAPQIGSGNGIVGMNALAVLDETAFWMGKGNFYMYDGAVREIPLQDNIQSLIFDHATLGVDTVQGSKVFAVAMPQFREIWWLYQSKASAGDIDRYIILNVDEFSWFPGTWENTVLDAGLAFEYPVGVGPDGTIYNHEIGQDANGVAMEKYVSTGTLDMGEGRQSYEVVGFWPDFDDVSGQLTITFMTRNEPDDAFASGVYTYDSDGTVDPRESGRQVYFDINSNVLGGKFRLGKIRLEMRPAGKR